MLVAESTETHVTHCAEKTSMSRTDTQSTSDTPVLPEDIGHSVAMTLIEEIVQVKHYGINMITLVAIKAGCIDSCIQCIVLLYIAMSDHDVSKVRLGPLTDYR